MISICPQHSQNYFKKEFFIQELKRTPTFHLPLTIKEVSHDVKQFSRVLKRFIQTPFILWKSILTLTGNE